METIGTLEAITATRRPAPIFTARHQDIGKIRSWLMGVRAARNVFTQVIIAPVTSLARVADIAINTNAILILTLVVLAEATRNASLDYIVNRANV